MTHLDGPKMLYCHATLYLHFIRTNYNYAFSYPFVFRLPSNLKKVFHPIIICATFAELSTIALEFLSKSGLDFVLGVNYSLS
ncbi:hypothetical protein VIGAN_01081600 [Vigna angularis var. angularis]|uniref:Uncharacterized protein n=1 Tax=Vigna angularis var. angularis TaxID=157739 RepID=A0A0S3QYE5_PHAAN|nr:hypothetical protein VIGAN_01081600 [Vigna angularis var. angularis]